MDVLRPLGLVEMLSDSPQSIWVMVDWGEI